MSKENNKTMTPKVRFPEFREAEEWVQVSFLAVRDKKTKWSFTGGPFGSNLKASDYVANGIRVIQLQNIGDGEFIDEYKIFTSTEKANELLSCNIYPGEIILSKMGDPVGRACIVPNTHERYVMCSDGIRLVVDEEKHDKYFIYSLINAKQFRALIEKTATGSTRKRIGLDELKQLPFFVPSKIKEQQKIASTLTSLDDLITAQSEKIKALQAHKKGLMQQLFPAEGERAPRVRFGEFEDDWEETHIGEKVDLLSGYPFKSSEISEDPSGIPLMRGINITEGFIRHSKDIDRFFLSNTQKLEKYMLRTNDLVIGMDGSKVGKNSALITVEDSGSLLIQRVARLRAKSIVTIKFIFHQINSVKFHTYVDRINTSGGIPHISANQINEFVIGFPNIEEQQKIAATLTSLDDLITTQHEKLEALKMQKKGLMQRLFPNPNDEAI